VVSISLWPVSNTALMTALLPFAFEFAGRRSFDHKENLDLDISLT
jgi:hypothetical protein